ncbi:MAG TPA: UvrD-helicase domain-containing protein, partial [Solirubrobacteraceae bacterium]|nr:UvrD-helicase domain-containing protein [Solirubrobacteraceae bacterium]
LTFTEKAAGELRERARKRLHDLGEDEHARAVDAAWIGTIHGFCARVLRARPLAAGLDPRFTVLEETAAGRLAAAAYERALEAWVAALGRPAVDLAAAYGPGLRDLVLLAHDTLRSRGRQPRLAIPAERPAPSPAALVEAHAVAAAELAGAGDGIRVTEGRSALDACARLLAPAGAGGDAPPAAVPSAVREARPAAVSSAVRGARPAAVPSPGELDAAKLGAGAKALATEACEAYRTAWETYRSGCADHHARAAVILLDELLARFAREYAEGKAERAAVDFEDLELGVRDLFSDEAERRRWSERFALLMVDEFQDTNRLQLDLLEALERDTDPTSPAGTGNLFAVGDEFQSIYRFRHADVQIFRERRAKLDAARVRGLRANFRSAPELLDVLNATFAPVFGDAFQPLVAGRPRDAAPAASGTGELRLFDPDPPAGVAPVELLVTASKAWDELAGEVGLGALAEQPWRRAEARLVAHRLREEVRAGRRPGDVVVLVRATASLRLFEQALEEQGLPTYVVGGRGYWSQEQVRDGLAYLGALANPRDETAFYGVLASPFCGAGSDALVLLAQAGREGRRGPWAALRAAALGPTAAAGAAALGSAAGTDALGSAAGTDFAASEAWFGSVPDADRERLVRFAAFFAAERARAERLPPEALLERAITATGYDLAILARAGGERRLANLRKLMRLAREYEHSEGRDLRGFLEFAATQDLAEAREGEAALESDGLDAVRLMTIHRAKGLEFPVVCVVDLGRLGAGGRPRLLIGEDGEVGLRLAPLGGGDAVPALAYRDLAAAEDAADAEEERRLLYVAMTRARETLILSGGTDVERWPEPRPGGAPLDWIVRAIAGGDPHALFEHATDHVLERTWDGRAARVRCALNAPATLGPAVAAANGAGAAGGGVMPRSALAPEAGPRPGAATTALPKAPKVMPAPPVRARPAPQRLSYTALQAYARCGYRFYLQRVLGLPDEPPPPPLEAPEEERAGLDPLVRGGLAHALLESLDFGRPEPPDAETVAALAARHGVAVTAADVEDLRAIVGAFARSPLCERLAAAPTVRREAGFAFSLEPGGGGSLVNGFVDVIATESGGGRLIVDYKTDRLDGADPA